MQTPLSSEDLRDLHQTLEAGSIPDFYQYLSRRSYGLAAWAVTGTGADDNDAYIPSPVDFLRNSPLPGICKPIFQILTKAQIEKMRIDLAKAYFRSLHRIARHSAETTILRDVNAAEVTVLHREALERNGLSIENWNLHFPFAILKRLGGGEAVDVYWEFLRDAPMRSPTISRVASLATVAFIYKQTMSTDTKVRQMASSWLSRNPAMESHDTIETRFNWGLDAARYSDHRGMANFLEALDLENHGIPRETDRTSSDLVAVPEQTPEASQLDDWETELESVYIYRALMARLTGAR